MYKRFLRRIAPLLGVTMVLALALAGSNAFAQNYWPSGGPASYYLLPGQSTAVSGQNFAPGEQVTLVSPDNQTLATMTANDQGAVSQNDAIKAGYNQTGSNQTYHLNGQTSGTSVAFTMTIGRYYPQIQPSSYYIPVGQTISVAATGFAPGETVHLLVGGTKVAEGQADASGNLTFSSVTMPTSGDRVDIAAHGMNSGEVSQRTVWLAPSDTTYTAPSSMSTSSTVSSSASSVPVSSSASMSSMSSVMSAS